LWIVTVLSIIIPVALVIIIIETTILVATISHVPLTAFPNLIYLAPFSAVLIGWLITTLDLSFNIVVMVMDSFFFLCLIHHDNTSVNK